LAWGLAQRFISALQGPAGSASFALTARISAGVAAPIDLERAFGRPMPTRSQGDGASFARLSGARSGTAVGAVILAAISDPDIGAPILELFTGGDISR